MADRSAVRFSFILFLLLGHAVAGAEYFQHQRTASTPESWTMQAASLLAVSAALSAVLPFLRNRDRKILLIAIQACIFLIVGYPEGDSYTVATVLTSLVVLEAAFLLELPYALAGAVLMIALQYVGLDYFILWKTNASPVSGRSRLLLLFFPPLLGTVAFWLRKTLRTAELQREMIERLDNAVTQLTGANVNFQEYAAAAERESAGNERKRIARDIHDTIGYHLMNVIMMMEAGADIVPNEDEKLKDIIIQTRDQAKEGLKETRNALRALRSMEEVRLNGVKAVKKLIDVFVRVTGVTVQLEYGNLPPNLPEDVFSFIYRMVQEGLTNAFKHGRATKIVLHFWVGEDNTLRIRMRDNGKGLSGDLKTGIGLAGMKERVAKMRGYLTTGNVIDGFELVVEIPLSEDAELRETKHEQNKSVACR